MIPKMDLKKRNLVSNSVNGSYVFLAVVEFKAFPFNTTKERNNFCLHSFTSNKTKSNFSS